MTSLEPSGAVKTCSDVSPSSQLTMANVWPSTAVGGAASGTTAPRSLGSTAGEALPPQEARFWGMMERYCGESYDLKHMARIFNKLTSAPLHPGVNHEVIYKDKFRHGCLAGSKQWLEVLQLARTRELTTHTWNLL